MCTERSATAEGSTRDRTPRIEQHRGGWDNEGQCDRFRLCPFPERPPVPALLYQRLPGGQDCELMKFGSDAAAIGVGLGGGQTLAKLNDFFLPCTAPPDLGASAGCGHTASCAGFGFSRNLGRFSPKRRFSFNLIGPATVNSASILYRQLPPNLGHQTTAFCERILA